MTQPEFPTLYKQTSTGGVQEWRIAVEGTVITTTYGLIDGKKQTAQRVITEGKNIGRSNETTPEQQAAADAQSMFDKQRKKHYVLTAAEAAAGTVDSSVIAGGAKPMLAHSYEKQADKITFPAAVQPKLDGHRCIATVGADGSVTLWSRTQKLITGVPHISAALETLGLTEGTVLDGELYNHAYRNEFEQLTSLIRQKTPKDGHEAVQYHVYDVPSMPEAPFSDRASFLAEVITDDVRDAVRVVETQAVEDEAEMREWMSTWLDAGYEGLMIRNTASPYKNGRSRDLQKVKTFDDAEYTIIKVEEGVGRMAGRAIFVCAAVNGEEFRCKMAGPLDALTEIWDSKDEYVGKTLTVQYQGLSANGIPRFPVGLRLRQDV